MSIAIGMYGKPRDRYVRKDFEVGKNAKGNLIADYGIVAQGIAKAPLTIIKKFTKGQKVSTQVRCDSGGIQGNTWRTCYHKININGKDVSVKDDYFSGVKIEDLANTCKEVSHPFGQGSMTMLECYDETGKIKSSKIISSTSDYRNPETMVGGEESQLARDSTDSNKTLYIVAGVIALVGIGFYLYKK